MDSEMITNNKQGQIKPHPSPPQDPIQMLVKP